MARAFTLLEMLVVVVLAVGLIGASTAAYFALIQSTALNSAAGMLTDFLTEGRQDAVTQNMAVEVRFYAIAGSTVATPAYRAAQLHWLEPGGTTPAIHPALWLPGSIVLDATAAHSSLLAANPDAATPDASDPFLNGQTRVFRFLTDGSIDLNPATPWFLTLRAASQSDPAHFPSDWACLTLDAITGRVQVFQP